VSSVMCVCVYMGTRVCVCVCMNEGALGKSLSKIIIGTKLVGYLGSIIYHQLVWVEQLLM